MTPVSAKKILELVPKALKKSKETTDPLDKFKSRVEKKFTKLTDDQKKLKEQFKKDNKNTVKELKALKTEIETLKKIHWRWWINSRNFQKPRNRKFVKN